MNRKIAGAILLLWLGIGVVIFLTFFTEKKTTEINCEEFKYPLFRLICEAYKEKNIEKCDYFKYAYKELCAKAVFAAMKVNESFCYSFENRVYRDICLMKLAIQTGDYKYCTNDCCNFIMNNPEACENIGNEIMKAKCFAKVYRNESYCVNIPGDEYVKNECICLSGKKGNLSCENVLIEKENPDECNIFIGTERALCISLNIKNLEECGNFLSGEKKELCKLFYLTKVFYGSDTSCVYTELYV